MNSGLASVFIRLGWSEDEKRRGVFILTEKMEKGRGGAMDYSLLIRRQGGVSELFECEMKNGQTASDTLNVPNTCKHLQSRSYTISVRTYTHTYLT